MRSNLENLYLDGDFGGVPYLSIKSLMELIGRCLQPSQDNPRNKDADAVARGVEAAHDENTSILSYNNENSLACVLSIAFYYARNDYVIHRELPIGKGFADIVLIPRKNVDSPVIILELKVNKDVDSAIAQILRKDYPAKLREYADRLLLVGISYDRDTKQHSCEIRRLT